MTASLISSMRLRATFVVGFVFKANHFGLRLMNWILTDYTNKTGHCPSLMIIGKLRKVCHHLV